MSPFLVAISLGVTKCETKKGRGVGFGESIISKLCCIFEHFGNIICDKRETTDAW